MPTKFVFESSLLRWQELLNFRAQVSEDATWSHFEGLFNMMALNTMWQMISSERYDYKNEEMKRLLRFIEYFNEMGKVAITGPVAAFPFLG